MKTKINPANKIPTGVVGLDNLFFDGIQLRQFFNKKDTGNELKNSRESKNNKKEEEKYNEISGLIIIVKGPRGVDKTLLVMQMLHGLTKSLKPFDECNELGVPCFYSLNKPKEQLMDMLLDTLISKMVYQITREHLSDKEMWTKNDFCKFIFNLGTKTKNNVKTELFSDFKKELDKHLAEETIYYNNRTNALHLRKPKIGDDKDNLLYCRKYDSIDEYASNKKNKNLGNLTQEIFPVSFNLHLENSKKRENKKQEALKQDDYNYFHSPLQDLSVILNNIGQRENNKNENALCDNREKIIPCLVLDGITQLALDELRNINFSHMERVFRQNSLISILVFDDTEDTTKCNADIVIEMRRMEDKELNYSYHQLRISKCVFQQVAYGWHQYKKKDYGIEVYPSSHFLVSKRRHMPKILRTAHTDILEENYEKYLEPYIKYSESGNEIKIHEKVNYKSYNGEKIKAEWNRLKLLFEKYDKSKDKDYDINVLRNIFTHNKNESTMIVSGNKSEKSAVTALIGLPNTYKRFLANGFVFSASHRKRHVLYTLLDKDEQSMLNQMICPGMINNGKIVTCHLNECHICKDYNCILKNCRECYKYIHFFDIRMGCIGSDELFHYLKEQITLPHDKNNKIERIIVDDLQKIDFSFPFLKKDNLFLTTLMSICKDKKVELLILCDENASLKNELVALADNVIRTERTYDKDYKQDQITLHVEKYIENYMPSRTYSYKIDDIYRLFSCNEELKINDIEERNIAINRAREK